MGQWALAWRPLHARRAVLHDIDAALSGRLRRPAVAHARLRLSRLELIGGSGRTLALKALWAPVLESEDFLPHVLGALDVHRTAVPLTCHLWRLKWARLPQLDCLSRFYGSSGHDLHAARGVRSGQVPFKSFVRENNTSAETAVPSTHRFYLLLQGVQELIEYSHGRTQSANRVKTERVPAWPSVPLPQFPLSRSER